MIAFSGLKPQSYFMYSFFTSLVLDGTFRPSGVPNVNYPIDIGAVPDDVLYFLVSQ
jgi:hypothetical protein